MTPKQYIRTDLIFIQIRVYIFGWKVKKSEIRERYLYKKYIYIGTEYHFEIGFTLSSEKLYLDLWVQSIYFEYIQSTAFLSMHHMFIYRQRSVLLGIIKLSVLTIIIIFQRKKTSFLH